MEGKSHVKLLPHTCDDYRESGGSWILQMSRVLKEVSMVNYLVGGILVLLVVSAVLSILKLHKNKKKCKDCPYGDNCNRSC